MVKNLGRVQQPRNPTRRPNIGKDLPQQAEVAQGVPGRLRPLDFLDVRRYEGGRSSALRAGRLYPRINPWYSFLEADSTSGHMVLSEGTTEKNPK